MPRFHITWGTGPRLVEIMLSRLDGVRFLFRHRVDDLVVTDGAVTGVRGRRLAAAPSERGAPAGRDVVGEFELTAPAVLLSSGGIGGNHDMVRAAWPERLGAPPRRMISGVPDYVDGRGLAIAQRAGARLINPDRMWHYVEGIENHSPVWPMHGIRILPGPSSLWLDATGRRLPVPLYPGFDTLDTLAHLRGTGYDDSWFVTTQRIVGKEFALSGSEQNPDLTGRSVRGVLERARVAVPAPVRAFVEHGADFVTAASLPDLVAGMNAIAPEPGIDLALVHEQVAARDRETANRFSKDLQVTAVRGARSYLGDRLIRVARPHRLLDPKAGPLIAVRLSILTRKTLGGLETDLSARALDGAGDPLPGLFAAGEVAGFGGGGMHGYRSLEGTFLGGCLFSGRTAGKAMS